MTLQYIGLKYIYLAIDVSRSYYASLGYLLTLRAVYDATISFSGGGGLENRCEITLASRLRYISVSNINSRNI